MTPTPLQLTLCKDEFWNEIPGYEGYYLVSNKGRVKSMDRQVRHSSGCWSLKKSKLLKSQLQTNGYHSVALSKLGNTKLKSIHRLVAETFISNPQNKKEVNHINGIKIDNSIENLEWATRSENAIHAFKIGKSKKRKGSKHPMSKINEGDVLKMREMRRNGVTGVEISKIFNITYSNVMKILKGNTWSHVPLPEDQYVPVTDKFNPYK